VPAGTLWAQAFGFFLARFGGLEFHTALTGTEDGTFSLHDARERDKAKDLPKVRFNLPRRNGIGSPGS
jgi:hypothetical protein